MTKLWTVPISACLAALFSLLAPPPVARADIYQWQYINPANPSQGKQPSTMLCPGGAGAYVAPGADLSNRNLTLAYLIGADLSAVITIDFEGYLIFYDVTDLTGANLSGADARNARFDCAKLTGANLSHANLTNVSFWSFPYWDIPGADLTNANLSSVDARGASFFTTTLTSANFTDADVRGANFTYSSGFTSAQIYSTASYQAHDLSGIILSGNYASLNLVGQNLTNASFLFATLTDANFNQANATNANFSTFNGTSADLTEASFSQAKLTNADFSGTGSFGEYSPGANLTNANFSSADARGANFHLATLTDANFSQADLTNANFSGEVGYDDLGNEHIVGGNLTGGNLSGADARGANFDLAVLTDANTSNLIQSNGHIAGLDLSAGASLVVRDYDGNPAVSPPVGSLPIVVEQHLAMNATGALRLVFDADPWNSTISFAPGISVTRGGTLELTFAPNVNLASQLGRTVDLFDWTGVTPTGAFTVSSPYTWNVTNLYTTGEVTLTAVPSLPGDFNLDGTVDAADYVVWRKTDGTPAGYNDWRTHFGQTTGSGSVASANATVPEPTTLVMLVVAAVGVSTLRRCRTWPVSKLNNM